MELDHSSIIAHRKHIERQELGNHNPTQFPLLTISSLVAHLAVALLLLQQAFPDYFPRFPTPTQIILPIVFDHPATANSKPADAIEPPQHKQSIARDSLAFSSKSPHPNSLPAQGTPLESYEQRLSTWLKQHYRSPSSYHASAQAILWLRVAKNGRIMAYRLQQPSGDKTLDASIINSIKSQSHAPTLPTQLDQEYYDFLIPVVAGAQQ